MSFSLGRDPLMHYAKGQSMGSISSRKAMASQIARRAVSVPGPENGTRVEPKVPVPAQKDTGVPAPAQKDTRVPAPAQKELRAPGANVRSPQWGISLQQHAESMRDRPVDGIAAGELISSARSCLASAKCDVHVERIGANGEFTNDRSELIRKDSTVQLMYPMIQTKNGVYMRTHGVDRQTGQLETRMVCIQARGDEPVFENFRTPWDQWVTVPARSQA